MSDRSFGIFMAFAVAVLVVIMSTPLTALRLRDATSQLLHRISTTQASPAHDVIVAQN